MNTSYVIPADLKSAIEEGRCIAFVGAGFAGAAQLPTWESLLTTLAQRPEIADRVRQYIQSRLQAKRADANEEAAQLLQDQLGRDVFISSLRELLCGKDPPPAMQKRLALLKGIPFRAILTVNFDDLLEGKTPSAETFWSALHSEHAAQRSLYTNYHRLSSLRGPITIKLHGDLNVPESVVFSRLDYRKRLYASPAYLGFLRAVFLNYTILYLGFSFTDAYLNELRSEALAILGSNYHRPTAYAVTNDVPEFTRDHFKSVEGIEILNYDTDDGAHTGFDAWLRAIHEATNPVVQFGALLRGKRILWVDPRSQNNDHLAYGFFVDAAKLARHDGCEIEHAANAEEALSRLKPPVPARSFDLVISHWGHTPGKASTAVRLLTGIRKEDIRVPVIIFSLQQYADERKPIALGLGAQGYFYTNEGLLQAIERILLPGVETG